MASSSFLRGGSLAALASFVALSVSGVALAQIEIEDPEETGLFQLSTGVGDGSINVFLDGFGNVDSALFDPVGSLGSAETFFESGVYFPEGGIRTSSFDGLIVLDATPTQLQSNFFVGSLGVSLTQSVSETFEGTARVGSVLSQVFSVQNLADVPNNFDIVRYLDGDLDFDGSISDGGGITQRGRNRILFETDAAESGSTAATFVGITSSQGNTSAQGNFEISSFSGLRSTVESGGTLGNFVEGDNDGDNFIDEPYDVTLATQEFFRLNPGQTVTYTTSTLFGNAVPPAPGSTEAAPLLPTLTVNEGGQQAFVFDIDPADIIPFETIFIDPVVAVGYTYEITGATFDSVTAPTLAAVPDPNGYTLFFDLGTGEQSVALLAGETFDFLVDIDSFRIEGIDTSLLLDPTDTMAFVTGVALSNVSGPVSITQTPLTFDTDSVGAAVPLPAGVWFMLTGLGGLVAARRAGKAKA